ncbi:hypothetical protein [Rhizobium sp. C4]|uniref:hypothetical protein n=1 Tax=Rhizobium sp. C4 TaxID=1349800 RepID=UPI001E5292B0|nr:hypothetical protein [Rhizobium sp. C4]MCD2173097.1 hypothetical protein [Rhizobium sp. C4]
MRHAIEGDYRRYEQRQLAALLVEGSRHATHFDALLAIFKVWQERRRMRREMLRDLETMTETTLEDAGYTRREAEREARKPFWRA